MHLPNRPGSRHFVGLGLGAGLLEVGGVDVVGGAGGPLVVPGLPDVEPPAVVVDPPGADESTGATVFVPDGEPPAPAGLLGLPLVVVGFFVVVVCGCTAVGSPGFAGGTWVDRTGDSVPLVLPTSGMPATLTPRRYASASASTTPRYSSEWL